MRVLLVAPPRRIWPFMNEQDNFLMPQALPCVAAVLRDADVVVNAAAMKQVPTCEYFPHEAVRTNIDGAEHIVWAIQEHQLKVETVVGVSTDKACKPVNTMVRTFCRWDSKSSN